MKVWGTAVSLLIATNILAADTIAPITKVTEGYIDHTDPGATVIQRWGDSYFAGSWETLQTEIRQALRTFESISGTSYSFDFESNYYSVAFAGRRPGAKEPEVIRVLVHCDSGAGSDCVPPAPYLTRLPGVSNILEVFVDSAQDAKVARIYTSTPTADPLQAQLVKASKLIDLPGLAFRSRISSRGGGTPSDPLYVRVSRVTLPDRRGTITVASKITAGAETRADITKAFAEECSTLQIQFDPFSQCVAGARAAMCTAATAAIGTVADPVDDTGRTTIQHALSSATKTALETDPCKTELAGGRFPRHEELVHDLLTALLAVSSGSAPKSAEGTTTYENAPRTSLSLALLSGAIVNTYGAERAKLTDDGNLAADPLPGAMTAAALNFHASPIDTTTRKLSLSERFGGFVGYVITPEPGLAVGFRSVLFRGLSLNVGYAWLRVDQKRRDDTLGEAPTNPKDPLRSGISGCPFVGFGYSFE